MSAIHLVKATVISHLITARVLHLVPFLLLFT